MEKKETKRLEPLLRADLDSEWYLGATNINGVCGNGKLTAGISFWGELSVLRWPHATHSDQLRYLTAHGVPLRNFKVRITEDETARTYRQWGRPRVVSPNMGSFGGIYLPSIQTTSWFHTPEWDDSLERETRWQHYESDDTNVLVTTAWNKKIDVALEITDFIHEEADVLVRHFELTCGKNCPNEKGLFLYFANLCPSLQKTRLYPVSKHGHERKSDYFALYHQESDMILHFRPAKKSLPHPARQAEEMRRNPKLIGEYVENLESLFPEGGVFFAWGSSAPSNSHQVGRNNSKGRGGVPQDAFYNASTGRLGGSSAAARPANSALSFEIELKPGSKTEISIFIAVADKAKDAIQLLEQSRREGVEKGEKSAISYWRGFSSSLKTPRTGNKETDRVGMRSLLGLAVGSDKQTGAIVASISRQPPYYYDWPRDGAFFDCALDIAGKCDMVTKHMDFYINSQINKDSLRKKRGEFEGNYFADGDMGIIPFVEIDEIGLCGWDLWRHAHYLEKDERENYLVRAYPAIKMAANALLRRKPRKGVFQKKAHEDDNIPHKTSTLHGAVTTYLCLKAAVEAGSMLGETDEALAPFKEWSDQLLDAMIDCYSPEVGRFTRDGWRGKTWVIWPGRILPPEDERIQNQAQYLASLVEPFIEKETQGFAYASELLLACAVAWRNNKEKLAWVKEALRVMTEEVPTPGTGHFGEVALIGDFAGTGQKTYQNRTSIPHLWEGTVLFLALVAAYEPQWLDFATAPLGG